MVAFILLLIIGVSSFIFIRIFVGIGIVKQVDFPIRRRHSEFEGWHFAVIIVVGAFVLIFGRIKAESCGFNFRGDGD